MKLSLIKPEDNLNEAFLKQSLKREQIESFKKNLEILFSRINEEESEEHLKNIVSDFLKDTYYKQTNEINTHRRKDMVIHNGPKAADTVGVIIEAKKPSNKQEMISPSRPNAKALHELISYYLNERYLNDNKEIKHLIVTNIWEWYIFDAVDFENFFFDNKNLVKSYKDWNNGMLVGDTSDWFYEEVAKPFIDKELTELSATYFNLKDVKDIISNPNKEDDIQLVNLYKVLSGEHLLKKPFANDSNRLNKEFYNELLHILGLEEIKEGSKKLIDRKAEGKRDEGSLLENTINSLTVRNKLSDFANPRQFGETNEQQIYSLALELCINWLNRILFLKLLEGQLKQYHKGDTSFNFLNAKRINDYDELDELFFEVLALETDKRSLSVNSKFGNIPYLNSSLFEISDLESKTIQIGSLKGRLEIPLYSNTVLKDNNEKRLSGKKNTLHYLFEFLGAYNFASDGAELIQEENKSIINASVLGLIFEKINGYKDGSFFTPGFITMYMCRETIRRAVVQKFREAGAKEFEKLRAYEELKDKIEHTDKDTRKKANEIINSIKICDPAVGSGHFLVSALNEFIAIKADLGVLNYLNGNRVKEYKITVANDELIILDKETSKPFTYVLNQQQRPIDELQELQETLFHEKQTIIEDCLFGVDINPKSVTICRLRLWIELLKNAYYTKESNYKELETLPNIDINIKCGNSLINLFRFDEDLKAATPYFEKKVLEYKSWVSDYKNENDKEKKRGIRQLINDLKKGFLSKITDRNPVKIKLTKLNKEFLNKYVNQKLFAQDLSQTQRKDKERLDKEIKKLGEELDAYIKNPIYDNAFEWRFEFPEVLDNNGNYVGFDVVIGNPPYFSLSKDEGNNFYETHFKTFNRTGDIYCLFYELGCKILRPNQFLTFITSNKWMRASYGKELREFFINETNPYFIFDFSWYQVFENASVDTNILSFRKSPFENNLNGCLAGKDFNLDQLSHYVRNNSLPITSLESSYWSIVSQDAQKIKTKIENIGKKIEDWDLKVNYGIKSGYNEAFQINTETKEKLIGKDKKNEEIIVPLLRGRDIERFGYNFANLYLINTYNGFLVTIKDSKKNIKEDPDGGFLYKDEKSETWKKAKRIEHGTGNQYRINRVIVEKDYLSIFEHLTKYEDALKERDDQGNHWTNLRNCAYDEQFKLEKLVWAETMRVHKTGNRNFPRIGYDNTGKHTDKTVFIGVGKKLKYLLAVLNSTMGKWLIMEYVTKLDTGGYMMQKIFLDKIPIVDPEIKAEKEIEQIIDKILSAKKGNPQADTNELEKEIDEKVYELYGLTKEEKKIVKNQ